MATQPNNRSVTPLRQRMLDDMAMRAMGSRTQHDYVRMARHIPIRFQADRNGHAKLKRLLRRQEKELATAFGTV